MFDLELHQKNCFSKSDIFVCSFVRSFRRLLQQHFHFHWSFLIFKCHPPKAQNECSKGGRDFRRRKLNQGISIILIDFDCAKECAFVTKDNFPSSRVQVNPIFEKLIGSNFWNFCWNLNQFLFSFWRRERSILSYSNLGCNVYK